MDAGVGGAKSELILHVNQYSFLILDAKKNCLLFADATPQASRLRRPPRYLHVVRWNVRGLQLHSRQCAKTFK